MANTVSDPLRFTNTDCSANKDNILASKIPLQMLCSEFEPLFGMRGGEGGCCFLFL